MLQKRLGIGAGRSFRLYACGAFKCGARRIRRQIPAKTKTGRGMDMSTFDQREDSFEKRYVHDEELRFRAEARRNKLIGLWAAEKLGKTGADAQAYAEALVVAEVSAHADEQVVATVKKDFEAAGVDQSEHQIRRTMEEMLAKAKAEIQAGE
jgi:hypothetical protein